LLAIFAGVDPICINQNNDQEKSSQVQLMATIFQSAELVIGWLGGEDEKITLAFDTFQMLSDGLWEVLLARDDYRTERAAGAFLATHPILCQVDDDCGPADSSPADSAIQMNRRWAAVDFVLKLPYWERIWIFQEAVLASRLLLVCPSRALDFNTVSDAGRGMCRIRESWSDEKPSFVPIELWPIFMLPILRWSRVMTIDYIKDLLYDPRSPDENPGRMSLAFDPLTANALSDVMTGLKATNPKDYIYVMLGLNGMHIVPDYRTSTPVYVVYVDYVRAWVSKLSRPLHSWRPGSGYHGKLAFLSHQCRHRLFRLSAGISKLGTKLSRCF
jgi:hypothetical protein